MTEDSALELLAFYMWRHDNRQDYGVTYTLIKRDEYIKRAKIEVQKYKKSGGFIFEDYTKGQNNG